MHVLVGGVCWRSAFLTALEATTAPASASPSTVAEARELFDNLAAQAEEPLDYHQYAAGCQAITRAVLTAQGEGDITATFTPPMLPVPAGCANGMRGACSGSRG
eukprot:COSAG01_NODE_4753_length_4766_cov_2.343261_8_plen_104_part_00